MADRNEPDHPPPEPEAGAQGQRARVWPRRAARAVAALAVVLALALAAVWTQRERIAENVIAGEIRSRGIPMTYTVERIGGRRQVLGHVVVGDPRRPDLVVERAEVSLVYRLGFPRIGRVTLVRPRLYGSLRGGKLSFGTLDPLLFTGRKRAFQLPSLDLAIEDGRALIESDFGPLGVKAQGRGRLNDGFVGTLALAGPALAGGGCSAARASFYGAVKVVAAKPSVAGPLRLGRLACAGRDLTLDDAALKIAAVLDKDVKGAAGTAKLVTGALGLGGTRIAALTADTRFTYRDRGLTMRLDAGGAGVSTTLLGFGRVASEGTLRARDGFSTVTYRGSLDGRGLRRGPRLDRTLAAAQQSVSRTFLAPLLGQLRAALDHELRGSRLAADIDVRRAGGVVTAIVPQATLASGRGDALLALSRVSLRQAGRGPPQVRANFTTGGAGLPRIAGRTEPGARGHSVMRLAMGEYRAGTAALALPRLALTQAADGSLGFAGEMRASGALPGGFARDLVVPLDGTVAAGGALALFRRCTALRFAGLTLANLTLERRQVTLCPPPGGAIVRSGGGGLRIAAGAPSLDLAGTLGATPVRLKTGAVGLAYPGAVTARRVDVALGPRATASRFRIDNLQARFGREIAGTFARADVRLAATPLDLVDAGGTWRYAGNRLAIAGANFRLLDRAEPARFAPLKAEGAGLTLFANKIDARAHLRHAASGRDVTDLTLHHDLATGRGHADLDVRALRFDEGLQPADVSRLALGTIANARGTVSGTGRIEWRPGRVTSRGRFSTGNLDFAAAFGPVRGLSGTIVFSDLLGLKTAGDQELRVASLNPGIEVTEGVVRFSLDGSRLALKRATWPFLGGKLTLAPTTLNLGVSEARRYVLLIERLDAARFVERMGLTNIQATGIFDGELPLVFAAANAGEQVGAAVGTLLGIGTEAGLRAAASTPGSGRIVNGHLSSRPPGGNLSYVGELTYRDLSTMANFAFQTLRSLDYRQMDIALNGALEGEIVTNVRFDGVKQGAGAKRNILTRAVANLPIQMNINIRAPFYALITSLKAMYDPAFVKDPRDLGLIDAAGRPIPQPAAPPPDAGAAAAPPRRNIQPNESETMP